jgi:hypothetical protein
MLCTRLGTGGAEGPPPAPLFFGLLRGGGAVVTGFLKGSIVVVVVEFVVVVVGVAKSPEPEMMKLTCADEVKNVFTKCW